MSEDSPLSAGAPALRSLGLVGDPFDPPPGIDAIGLREVSHAAALRLLAAIDAAAGDARPSPIWVTKSPAIPSYYSLAALAETLSVASSSSDLDVLAGFIPLDMMHIGRIRSALSVVAENVGNGSFDLTLAAWVLAALRDFDRALPEAALMDEETVDRLRARLEDDPAGTLARYFGACEPTRDQGESVEMMMRVSGARQGELELEPEDAAAGEEEAGDDVLAESFVTPIGDAAGAEEVLPAEEDPLLADGLPGAVELVDYVVAYTREHLSPVVARGIRVYRAQGTSAMSQEFKVTKAPKKTLAALARFATHRYRKVVLIYDRFDNWNEMPDDNKPAIIGALSELRWALGDHGVMTLLVAEGQAPELAEQFAGARKLAWDFSTLAAMEQEPPRLDVEVVREWLASATKDGAGPAMDDGQIGRLIEAASGDLTRFLAMASGAVSDAASRGVTKVDDAAIEAASQRE